VFLGWAGGHRFDLGREFTGVLMLLTGGGSLIWWGIDGFLLLDVVPGLVWPALAPGLEVDLEAFVGEWIGEVFRTFFLVYAFSTAVGAVLVRHLLLRDSHRVPRLLAALTVISILLGTIVGS